jgi:hypothetical protein
MSDIDQKDESLIHFDDWFVDGDGKNWAVEAVDVERQEVVLRLVDKPFRRITLGELRERYTLGGARGFLKKSRV